MSNLESAHNPPISGVWLPIVTPFKDGEIDIDSYERLLRHYLDKGLSGIIPLGTTGEAPTISDDEAEALIELTLYVVGRKLPLYIGIGGNSTRKVVKTLRRLDRYPFDGILSVCPYYNRPSEEGIRRHFETIASSTDRNILIYNIPYRTGVNLSNDTVLALGAIPNIVGIKDSCANLAQTQDLLRRRPQGFSVLTGEDAQFYTALALGGDGGILASAHLHTETFVNVYRRMVANDHELARELWETLEPTVRLLFREPNPMPLKHYMACLSLIDSPECRLPLTAISESLAGEIDLLLGRAVARPQAAILC